MNLEFRNEFRVEPPVPIYSFFVREGWLSISFNVNLESVRRGSCENLVLKREEGSETR